MLLTLAVSNYRSLLDLKMPLHRLNVITGPNGSGKSNLYKALRLLSETAQGGVINAVAAEGGLNSTFWAGPETLSAGMKKGRVKVEGTVRNKPQRLKLGFAGEDFGYCIEMGYPINPGEAAHYVPSAFSLDPEIKRESIWAGEFYKTSSCLIDRNGPVIKNRAGRGWDVIMQHVGGFESLFGCVADPSATPEVFTLKTTINSWRFYDHFRTDSSSPARLPQLGTRTTALHHDGRDLAAALQTIIEIGDTEALHNAVSDAFPGARVAIDVSENGHFSVAFRQEGLLRPLSGMELSDGTLRYLLWVAALLTPRPPALMVLNEPETSLHPDLLPALGRLIVKAAENTQLWVISHSQLLIKALKKSPECHLIELEKNLGETQIKGQKLLDQPPWYWPDAA